jgi:hypothetical protein
MPGEPEEVQRIAGGRWYRGLQSSGGDHQFLAARAGDLDSKRKAPALLVWLTAGWVRVDEERPFQLGGFNGRAFSGALDAQHQVMARAVIVGDEMYFAQVVGPEGRVDQARAQAFLDSFEVDVPWRIHTSLEGRYTVAVPAPASWMVDTKEVLGWTFKFDAFALGGVDHRIYAVMHSAIPPSDVRSMDEILRSIAESLATRDDKSILKREEMTLDGFPVLEIVVQIAKGVARQRIYGAEGRITIVMITSDRSEPLDDAGAARFFESFQLTTR